MHRGISRFSGAQVRSIVRRFASPRNDLRSLPLHAANVTAAAVIRHAHQLRDHAHHLAAAHAAHAAHHVAAAIATVAAHAAGDHAAIASGTHAANVTGHSASRAPE